MLSKIITKNTFFNILVFLLVFPFTGCKKEDSCNGDEPFVEPAWVKTIQNEYSKDSTICFADMRLFLMDGKYYIYQNAISGAGYDEYTILYNCNGQILQTNNNPLSSFLNKAEELEFLWIYVNEKCIWKPDFNDGCPSLETDSQEIITGRWKRVKTFYKTIKAGNKYVGLYRPVDYHYWLVFNPGGSVVTEYYDTNNEFIKYEGHFTIDSLLYINDSYPSPWSFEFSYCNKFMKLTLNMGFDATEYIYERVN